MNVRKAAVVILAAALVVVFGTALPASATAACYGDGGASCHNLDPANTVKSGTSTLCSTDAATEHPVGTNPHIEIRYSRNCRAAWIRVQGLAAGTGLHLTVTWTNPRFGTGGTFDVLNDTVSFANVQNYTFMVNAPDSTVNFDGSCTQNVVVSARADATGMATSFATPADNLGHLTC
jgi:hypothetical protein